MKNLKRALSFALATVMLVGMMVVGVSAADFGDADKIEHAEAVNTLVTLGVIKGKDDGNFDPEGIVTRAEMAKMICVALNGGKDPVLGTKAVPTYTDIKGHWAESYIEYCSSLGIVAGRGDGSFDPDATVTATEAAKMLLVAMNYNSKVFEFTGASWAINVNREANSAKLYDGIEDVTVDAGIARDAVAQMVFNAIQRKTMYRGWSQDMTTGNITETYRLEGDSILLDKFGVVKVEGVVTKNEYSKNSEEGKTTLAITNGDELTQAGHYFGATATFKVTTGADEFGRAVALYVKPAAAAATSSIKATVLGGAILSDVNDVYTTTAKTAAGDTLADVADDNGLELDDTNTYTGSAGQAAFDKDLTTYVANYATQTSAIATAKNGEETVLIDNDGDGVVEIVLQNTYTFGKVTTYSTANDGKLIIQSASGTATETKANENVVGMADIAKDDFVNYIKVDDTYYVTKAKTFEGKMDAFKASTNIVVDGDTYKLSGNTLYTNGGKITAISTIASTTYVGKDLVVYLDAFGYAIGAEAAAAKSFLYVSNAASNGNDGTSMNSNGTVKAYVVLEDGITATYVVDDVDGYDVTGTSNDTIGAHGVQVGAVYKYVIDADGKLDLTTIAEDSGEDSFTAGKSTTTAANANFLFENGKSTVTTKTGQSILADNSTLFIYITKNDTGSIKSMTTYVGKDKAPSVKATSGNTVKSIVVANSEDATLADLVVVETKATAASNFIYLYKYVKSYEDTVEYLAIVGDSVGEKVTVKTTDTKLSGAYEYTINSDDEYELSTAPATTVTAHTKLVSGNALVLNNGIEVSIKDAVIAIIDGDDTAVGYTLNTANDYVTVVYDSTTLVAKAVYVLEAYASDNANVLAVNGTTTKVTTETGFDYKSAHASAADVKNSVVVSAKASKVVLAAAEPGNLAAAKTATDATGTLTSGGTYYLVVVSEDGTAYSVSTIKCNTAV